MFKCNRKTLMAAGLIAAFACTAVQAKERTIRFGTDAAYAPFESTTPSGDIVGFDIDIAKAICAKLQAKCTFQNQSWDGIIPALHAKKFDVISSSMSITDERKRAVAFTDKVWATPNVLIGKEGVDINTTPEATAGKDIGIQQGTTQDKYASKYFTKANIRRYKTFEDALNDLKTGRVVAIFADGGVANEFLKSDAGKGYVLLGDTLQNDADKDIFGAGTGFAVRKSDKDLLNDLNKALQEIHDDGTYEKLNKQYFPFSVYESK
ncbi:transporter substrate-binding domain-containing protein [Brackiella oedipodis]|uniref:transporter substrate-binding domain-containing protein n=1 Tax=Brackiella oedipodis TaxID=124225 RepID=UPI000490A652|nr:transporter substrate-binding domain-containing protein [Brackiella oedipodis]